MDPRAEVDVEAAMRAFDQLATDGPRVVMNELRTMANETKFHGEMTAPGSLATGWRVEEMADPRTSETFGWAAMPNDKPQHGGKPVARWQQYGTGDMGRGGKRVQHNESHLGHAPQPFLKKTSKRKQMDMIYRALIRTARRAGFETGGPL